jgi:hypothetical protein
MWWEVAQGFCAQHTLSQRRRQHLDPHLLLHSTRDLPFSSPLAHRHGRDCAQLTTVLAEEAAHVASRQRVAASAPLPSQPRPKGLFRDLGEALERCTSYRQSKDFTRGGEACTEVALS